MERCETCRWFEYVGTVFPDQPDIGLCTLANLEQFGAVGGANVWVRQRFGCVQHAKKEDISYRSLWWSQTFGMDVPYYRHALYLMCEQIHEEQRAAQGYSGYASEIRYEAIVRLYVLGMYEGEALWSHVRPS